MARRRYLDESRPSMEYVKAMISNTDPETGRVNYGAINVPWNSTPTRKRTTNTRKKNNTRWVPKTKDQALRSLGETKEYVVKSNDTLSKIDSKRWRDIAIANDISDSNKIQVGQRLIIPKNADGISTKEIASSKVESTPNKVESTLNKEISTTTASTDSTATPKSTVSATTPKSTVSATTNLTPSKTPEETSEETPTITYEETNRSLLTRANDRISKAKQYVNSNNSEPITSDKGNFIGNIRNYLNDFKQPILSNAPLQLELMPSTTPFTPNDEEANSNNTRSNSFMSNLRDYVHPLSRKGQQELAQNVLNGVRLGRDEELKTAKTIDDQLAIHRKYNPVLIDLERIADPSNHVLNGEPGLEGWYLPEILLTGGGLGILQGIKKLSSMIPKDFVPSSPKYWIENARQNANRPNSRYNPVSISPPNQEPIPSVEAVFGRPMPGSKYINAFTPKGKPNVRVPYNPKYNPVTNNKYVNTPTHKVRSGYRHHSLGGAIPLW